MRIEVRSAAGPVPQAAVEAGGATRLTNPLGVALVAAPPGTLEVTISKDGFVPASVRVEVVSGTERQLLVELTPRPTVEEEVTVVATRAPASASRISRCASKCSTAKKSKRRCS